ncbi:MAG: GNAT family N-acetyltransferase [Myxococcales bacterium]|nr:GNAT family N-acetyltransferase [Myxococcales bacterium]
MREVFEITPDSELRAFLRRDPVLAAYPLGDLAPQYAPFCRWFATRDESGGLSGVALFYTGLRTPTVLTLGDPDDVDALLGSPALKAILPTRLYVHLPSSHLAAFQANFQVDALRPMIRMALHRDGFIPWRPSPSEGGALVPDPASVVRVGHGDTADLVALYRFYPDNFFEPYQLESGFYYGYRAAGHLISVAGIHVVSVEDDIAAIGNVVTHPEHRGRGYSRMCTTRLLEDLFTHVSTVALNVTRENVGARRIYEQLGFVEHLRYLEGPVIARHG